MSRAWRHRENMLRLNSEREAAAAAAETQSQVQENSPAVKEASAYELLLAAAGVACTRISAEPKGSQARKDLKSFYVSEFLPCLKTYIASGATYKNEVLTQVMIWLFDLLRITEAMELARVAVAQNQPMPERFKRDIRTGVADLVLEAFNSMAPASDQAFKEVWQQIFPESGVGWQIHEDIKIKYLKVAIAISESENDLRLALALCEKAESINPKLAQVKTKKEKLVKAVALLDEAARHSARKK